MVPPLLACPSLSLAPRRTCLAVFEGGVTASRFCLARSLAECSCSLSWLLSVIVDSTSIVPSLVPLLILLPVENDDV